MDTNIHPRAVSSRTTRGINQRHLSVADHTIPCGIDILPQLIQAIWSNNMMHRESVLKVWLMSSLSHYIHEWPPNETHTWAQSPEAFRCSHIMTRASSKSCNLLEKMWRNQQVHLLHSNHRLSHSTHKHAMAMRDKSNKILTSFHDVEVRWKSPLKTAMTCTIGLVPDWAETTKVKTIRKIDGRNDVDDYTSDSVINDLKVDSTTIYIESTAATRSWM